MSFVIAASDRSSGRVSGPSFSGISSFCGVSSVLLAMSLTAGTESAPDCFLKQMRRKITEFHRPRGFEKAQARARDHISVKCTCTRLQWRKSASLEAEILVFRHQLNVLTA